MNSEDIINLCQNKELRICYDQVLWKILWNRDFSMEEVPDYRQYYIQGYQEFSRQITPENKVYVALAGGFEKIAVAMLRDPELRPVFLRELTEETLPERMSLSFFKAIADDLLRDRDLLISLSMAERNDLLLYLLETYPREIISNPSLMDTAIATWDIDIYNALIDNGADLYPYYSDITLRADLTVLKAVTERILPDPENIQNSIARLETNITGLLAEEGMDIFSMKNFPISAPNFLPGFVVEKRLPVIVASAENL